MSIRPSRRAALGVGIVVALSALLIVAPAAAAPPGNNGTVKIHEGATEMEPIIRNDPHVCTFHLHFFFADPAQQGTWRILDWSPGGDREVVLSGAYDTNEDGIDRAPDTGAFGLPNGHYRLEWQGRNAHNVKHKMFWVECAAPTSSPTASVEPTESASPTTSVEPTQSTNPTGSVEGVTSQPTPPSTDTVGSIGSVQPTAFTAVVLLMAALIVATLMLALSVIPRRR